MTPQVKDDPKYYTVAIIGGGVAGLALANALEQSGISYVLWEARDIAPDAGASIGLLPYGLRILDQIGVLEEVERWLVEHDHWEHRDEDGTLLSVHSALREYPEKIGYSAFFLERYRLLEVLYARLEDKSVIRAWTEAVSVNHSDGTATVTAADGHEVKCDLVIGADGVHSTIRDEIDRLKTPEIVQNPEYLSTRFCCVYGISDPIPGIGPGMAYSIYREGASCLIFTGLNGVVFWFVFEDLGRSVPWGNRIHYDDNDLHRLCNKLSEVEVTSGVIFSDIYKRHTKAFMTPLEEGVTQNWFAERMLLLGDAAHKMVPHAAMGGNLALESVATFLNELLAVRVRTNDKFANGISATDVEQIMIRYAGKRRQRATALVAMAGAACRAQVKHGEQSKAMIEKLSQRTTQDWVDLNLRSFVDAEHIEHWHSDSERVRYYTTQARALHEVFATA